MGTMSSISIDLLEYDVFISFRGEDTRKKFTDYLFSGLQREQIKVYIDEKNLGKGEEISSTLLQAIQKSKISLIIFSENYASSSWCLDELVHILKCKEENGQIVVPIFYGIDPSHVRKQEGSFAHAFVAHQQRFEDKAEKLQEWRAALIRACTISGWDTRNRYESKVVEEIVEFVVSTVRPRATADSEGLVGINRHLKELESLLCFGSPDVRVLGIGGMVGIGKTTLARVVFKRFSSQFEGCCFLQDVRQISHGHGLSNLKRKLFSKLTGEEDVKMVNTFDWYRISRKKVLIVLDDVGVSDLVERLVGDRNWFGSGSRIILTARDINVLRGCAVDFIYEVYGLNDDEALELFRLNAFRRRPFISDYDQLSQSVVHYTRGIPLALKAFGSFLNNQYTSDWGSALDELIMNPSNRIYLELEVSYHGLHRYSQEIFLRIALFYEGRDTDFIERKLEPEFNHYPRLAIAELMDWSLISIKGDGQIYMHDLIRRMAWGIVRRYRPEWIQAEERFSGMSNFVDYKELALRRPIFGRRCHNCYDYPQKSLPLKINQHDIVELDMPSSKLKRFLSEVQDSSSRTTVRLIISYEGQWRETRGCWSFSGKITKGIIVSKDITYYQLVERLGQCLMVDQSLYDLDMRLLVVSLVPLPPVEIRHDDDVKFLIETASEGNTGYPLCIILVKKDTGQHVLVDNDRNVVNFLFQWRRKMRIF